MPIYMQLYYNDNKVNYLLKDFTPLTLPCQRDNKQYK